MNRSFLQSIPTYEAIFGNTATDTLKSVIPEKVPTFIKVTSYISSVLYLRHGTTEEDETIRFFEDTLRGTEDGRKIVDWCVLNNISRLNIILPIAFPFLYEILFEKYEVDKDECSFDNDDKILYLKILLIANSRLAETAIDKEKGFNADFKDRLSFQNHFWAIILPQYEKRNPIDFTFEMCRTLIMLSYIEAEKKYNKILKDFLEERGFHNILGYTLSMGNLLRVYYENRNNNKILCCFPLLPEFEKLFHPFSFSLPKAKDIQLTTHPILALDNQFFVLDWNYLAGQVFLGTYFSVNAKLKDAGIVDRHGNTPLKSELGKVMEEHLMKPIIESVFGNSSQQMKFDSETNFKGFPDAIILSGNDIFIFEFKDRLLSEQVYSSHSYSQIANNIDISFKDQGIKELVDYIGKFVNEEYKDYFCSYNENGISHIYPIILYTDYRYGIEGVNDYLVREYVEEIDRKGKGNGVSSLYKSCVIRPVTFISLDFFFTTSHLFNTKKLELHSLLEEYIAAMRERRQRMDSYTIKEWEEIPNTFKSFENYFHQYNYIHSSWDDMSLFLSHNKSLFQELGNDLAQLDTSKQ